MEESDDVMRLMTGTWKTAVAVLEGLEERRRANAGWLVPWPRSPETFADARMEEPALGTTAPRPNKDMRELQDYFLEIFDTGGTPMDLRKAWNAWNSPHPARMAK